MKNEERKELKTERKKARIIKVWKKERKKERKGVCV